MATLHEKEQARQYRHALGEHIPSSLRGPLTAVQSGTEVKGTATDVLAFARDALARIAPDKLGVPKLCLFGRCYPERGEACGPCRRSKKRTRRTARGAA